MTTAEKHARYLVARAEAQRLANDAARTTPDYSRKGGCDWGLEYNELFNTFSFRRLPLPHNRYGHELRMEVVRPEINRF
jgi:hypothetical protein